MDRRDRIVEEIRKSGKPLSASALAAMLHVSRQIIVGDVALLRARGIGIIATPRGYVWGKSAQAQRVLKFFHTDEQIEDELATVVEMGGKVESIFVYHRVYGKIEAALDIENRTHVNDYVHALSGNSKSLKNITGGYHYHLIAAYGEETLDAIEAALKEKGYLAE